VKKRIAELPEAQWTSVDALIALNLATQLDNQVGGASAAKELRLILAALGSVAPVEEVPDSVGDSRSSTAAKLRAVG
jgi:hypothetical protein